MQIISHSNGFWNFQNVLNFLFAINTVFDFFHGVQFNNPWEIGRVGVRDSIISDISIQQLEVFVDHISIFISEENWNWFFEVLQDYYVFHAGKELYLVVWSWNGSIGQIEEKSFSFGRDPQQTGKILIHKHNNWFDSALPPNLHINAVNKLILEVLKDLVICGFDDLLDQVKTLSNLLLFVSISWTRDNTFVFLNGGSFIALLLTVFACWTNHEFIIEMVDHWLSFWKPLWVRTRWSHVEDLIIIIIFNLNIL